jgi:hypothetical protein
VLTSITMKPSRTTVHIAKPEQDEYSLLRLLSPEEKLQVLLAAARAKAARIGTIDAGSDTGKEARAGSDEADLGQQDGK